MHVEHPISRSAVLVLLGALLGAGAGCGVRRVEFLPESRFREEIRIPAGWMFKVQIASSTPNTVKAVIRDLTDSSDPLQLAEIASNEPVLAVDVPPADRPADTLIEVRGFVREPGKDPATARWLLMPVRSVDQPTESSVRLAFEDGYDNERPALDDDDLIVIITLMPRAGGVE